MKKAIMLLCMGITINYSNAQVTQGNNEKVSAGNSAPLKGLRKANFTELDPSKPLMLDGISTPVYDENQKLIQGDEFMKVMSSGDFYPEVYIDNNKEVKAFVLRKATDLEKSQMIKMQSDADMPGNNELVGKKALPFSVTDINGNNYSLESLKGKVIVINFWFVECKPCVMEMPELNKLVDKYKQKDVVFLGFAINEKDKIKQFLKKNKFNYQVVSDTKDLVELYSIRSFPTHLVIDKNSAIIFAVSGLGPNTIDDLDESIEVLLK